MIAHPKSLWTFILLTLSAVIVHGVDLAEAKLIAVKDSPPSVSKDPLPERMLSLYKATTLTRKDLDYLRRELAGGNAVEECLALAMLYKHAPKENLAAFRSYFAIDRTKPGPGWSDDEVDHRVMTILKENQPRPPIEIMVRTYLSFRGSGLTYKRKDGTEVNIEKMFRDSVFSAVNHGSKQQELKFAATADGLEE